MGKRGKGKEGKPCIRQKTRPSRPTVKRTAAKLAINRDKPKCPDDIKKEPDRPQRNLSHPPSVFFHHLDLIQQYQSPREKKR
jgi:hypothetical protein